MPRMSIKRSVVINAPLDKVYASVRDFRQWIEWSPWLIMEPGCKVDYAEDGKSYSWDGKIVGSGGMEILEESEGQWIKYRLTFLKPFRSVSSVSFLFVETRDGVETTWTMDGSMPFFLFFLVKMMTALISMDYQRGLTMLKDYLETGAVPSKLAFPGRADFPGLKYVGISETAAIADMGPSMEAVFKKLHGWLETSGVEPAGRPLSIYDKWDLVNGTAAYTACIPVASVPVDLPDGFVSGEIPSCPVYPVRHTGPYRHLGNAWSSGMGHDQAKVFRQDKKIAPFEIYETDPKEGPEEETAVTVYFPVK